MLAVYSIRCDSLADQAHECLDLAADGVNGQHSRTPLQFVLSSWRDGWGGAFRMGLAHGLYCLGCCWLLFLILFPLGVMNIAVMAALTALIFAEKSLPRGRRIGLVAAVALIVYGVVVVLAPAALLSPM